MRRLRLAELGRDERGDAMPVITFGFALTWFVTCFVFLMNVQLGQLFYRRDVVDHACAIATDTAKKTYCANGENSAAAEQAVKKAIDPVMQTASAGAACEVSVKSGGESEDPGAKPLDVSIDCTFECKIPIAAQAMCTGGKVHFIAKLKTTALGCDGKGMGAS